MNNRFFDINKNVYLNSYYIYILMLNIEGGIQVKNLMLSLYLFKHLSKLNKIILNLGIKVDERLFEEYQINNIQSRMEKYSSSIYMEDFNEAISYLYSKNIIDYDVIEGIIRKTNIYYKIDKSKIPNRLIHISIYIQRIIREYGYENMENYL